jgi:hypothetical protein
MRSVTEFLISGWIINDSIYSGAARNGDKLLDWFSGIVSGAAPTHVGP